MEIEKNNQAIINETYGLLGFGEVHQTTGPIVRYRNAQQWFSVDGTLAYDVTPYEFTDRDGSNHKFTPVVIGKSTFHSWPEEGRTGMLTIWEYTNFKKRPDGMMLIWATARWLYTSELDLTPTEIIDNLIDDVVAGENVFTQKLPGWV